MPGSNKTGRSSSNYSDIGKLMSPGALSDEMDEQIYVDRGGNSAASNVALQAQAGLERAAKAAKYLQQNPNEEPSYLNNPLRDRTTPPRPPPSQPPGSTTNTQGGYRSPGGHLTAGGGTTQLGGNQKLPTRSPSNSSASSGGSSPLSSVSSGTVNQLGVQGGLVAPPRGGGVPAVRGASERGRGTAGRGRGAGGRGGLPTRGRGVPRGG